MPLFCFKPNLKTYKTRVSGNSATVRLRVKLLDHAHLCTVARRLDDNGIRLDQPNHFKSLVERFGSCYKKTISLTIEEATLALSAADRLRTIVELVEHAPRSQEVLGSIPDVGRRGFCTF